MTRPIYTPFAIDDPTWCYPNPDPNPGTVRRAHLIRRFDPSHTFGSAAGNARPSMLAWCGTHVSEDAPLAPYGTRCKACLRAVRKYFERASVPPPERVRETVTITIERDATDPPAVDVFVNKVATRKGWEMVEKSTSEVAASEPTD